MSGYADSHPQVASAIISSGGAVLVGAITLIGVGISLAHAHHRMKRELQAQRDLASEERAYAASQAVQTRLTEMRQDLYLRLIDQYQGAVSVIAGLPAVHPSELTAALIKMNDLHASVQKTSLVSDTATSNAASEAHSLLNELMFELMALIPAIRGHMSEAEGAQAEVERLQPIVDDAIAQAQDFRDRRIASLASHQNDQLLRRTLQAQKAYAERKVQAAARQLELVDAYQVQMFKGLKKVAGAAAAFFSLARQELGMAENSQVLTQKYEQTFDRAMKAVASMRKAIGMDKPPTSDESPNPEPAAPPPAA